MALHIAGGGSVGDQAVHVDVAVGKRHIDAGNIAMARQEATAPHIDAPLKAARPATGTRIGKGLIAIVDPLTEEAGPVGTRKARAFAAGVRNRQCVTDSFVQCAEHLQAHLPRDRLNHAIGRNLRPDDRPERPAAVLPAEDPVEARLIVSAQVLVEMQAARPTAWLAALGRSSAKTSSLGSLPVMPPWNRR